MTAVKKKPEHYVNNTEFSNAIYEYCRECKDASIKGKPVPRVTNYIAQSFINIAEGFARKGNYYQYPFKEEMIMDAVENCLKAINNFDIDKGTRTGAPNAFAYFTQITYYAFLRRIAKEKRQLEIKENFINSADISDFMIEGEGDTDFVNGYKNYPNKTINDVGSFSTEFNQTDYDLKYGDNE